MFYFLYFWKSGNWGKVRLNNTGICLIVSKVLYSCKKLLLFRFLNFHQYTNEPQSLQLNFYFKYCSNCIFISCIHNVAGCLLQASLKHHSTFYIYRRLYFIIFIPYFIYPLSITNVFEKTWYYLSHSIQFKHTLYEQMLAYKREKSSITLIINLWD